MNRYLFSSTPARERIPGRALCHTAALLGVSLARAWRPIALGFLRVLLFVTTLGDFLSWGSWGDPSAFLPAWQGFFPHLTASNLSLCAQLTLWGGLLVSLLLVAVQTPLLDVDTDDLRHALRLTLACAVFCLLLFGLLWLAGMPASVVVPAGTAFWLGLLGCLTLGASLNCAG